MRSESREGTESQEERRVVLYSHPVSLGEDGYRPDFARVVITQEDLVRILSLQEAVKTLGINEIRDASENGPLIEWFGGDNSLAECGEMVVTESEVYWTALPPQTQTGGPFQTWRLLIASLQETLLDEGVDTLFIGATDEVREKAEAEAAYAEYLQARDGGPIPA